MPSSGALKTHTPARPAANAPRVSQKVADFAAKAGADYDKLFFFLDTRADYKECRYYLLKV
jgi:hypothetical protein